MRRLGPQVASRTRAFRHQGMVDSLRQNRGHPTVLAAAKLVHCTACQESARMLSHPVTGGKVMEPGAAPTDGQFPTGSTP